MRIIVFSDTHKDTESCIKTINRLVGIDMILHAGDHVGDAMEIAKAFPDIPVHYVAGNCDFSSAPSDLVVEAEGKRIFLTHGHGYGVKSEENYTTLREYALKKECDCAVFGHTHLGFNDPAGKVVLLNPGSVKYGQTFGVIEIENGKLKTAICNI